MTIKCWW